MEFVPQPREVIHRGERAGGSKAAAPRLLNARLGEVLNSEQHRWFLGKMSPGELAARKKAAEEFKKRYTQ